MVEVVSLLTEAWLLFLLSLVVSAAVFPIVFVFSFIYDALVQKYRRTPRVLLMAVCTFIAVLLCLVFLELYVSVTIPEVVSALRPSS